MVAHIVAVVVGVREAELHALHGSRAMNASAPEARYLVRSVYMEEVVAMRESSTD
jgi:hypothetical protein